MTGSRWSLAALCALLVGVATAGLAGRAAAAPTSTDLGIRFLPAQQPSVFVRFRNNRMWVAATQAGLDTAQPIRAAQSENSPNGEGGLYRYYGFPETALPVSLEGVSKVSATLSFMVTQALRPGRAGATEVPSVGGRLSIAKRDNQGVTWTYAISASTAGGGRKAASEPLTMDVPRIDTNTLTMEIVTKVEGRSGRIGLQVKSGENKIENVLKDGKNAPAKIEVLSKDDKVVISEAGDLQKFGFT